MIIRNNTQALILGCSGFQLNKKEKDFFKKVNPTGFILFKRNCASPKQVQNLTCELRDCLENEDAPILVDQEGGRVQRLCPPNWDTYPSMKSLVMRSEIKGENYALEAIKLNARIIAYDLNEIGITVNCAPVLDVPIHGADPIVSDRAFSQTPEKVKKYGRAACLGYLQGGIMPVIKHIPGHGRASVDSHKKLPIINTKRTVLDKTDFLPFRSLSDMPWAMTAHVVFTNIDALFPASLSEVIIRDLIRMDFQYNGILISDDLSMGALEGSFKDRTKRALDAGCDLALHCNGDLNEMKIVVEGSSKLRDETIVRLEEAEQLKNRLSDKRNFDITGARHRLSKLLI